MGQQVSRAPRPEADDWDALVLAFARDREHIRQQFTPAIRVLPSYAEIDPERLDEDNKVGMEVVVTTMLARRPTRREDLAGCAELAESQAALGVSLEDVLYGSFIGYDTMRAWVRDQPVERYGSAAIGEFVELLHTWLQQLVVFFVDAFHARRRRALLNEESERREFLRRLLLGHASEADLRLAMRAYGLAPDRPYYAMRATVANVAECDAILTSALQTGHATGQGVVAPNDDEIWGIVSAKPEHSGGAVIGIAGPVLLPHLATAFRRATTALRAAAGLGLEGVHDVGSLGLHMAILEDQYVSDDLARRYIEPIESSGAPNVILDTVRAFIRAQGNAKLASREVDAHPNTVRHRIRRFEDLTGARLHDTADLVSVWWALEWRAMTSRKERGPAVNPNGRDES